MLFQPGPLTSCSVLPAGMATTWSGMATTWPGMDSDFLSHCKKTMPRSRWSSTGGSSLRNDSGDNTFTGNGIFRDDFPSNEWSDAMTQLCPGPKPHYSRSHYAAQYQPDLDNA